ncbi:MAG: DinB family protein [Acidobacteriota bacterium]|nr:DinB family protein [Acidobacteriota bacterium]
MADLLIREIEQEMKATREMLSRVPSDNHDWKPHERSMSLGALARHLAMIPLRVKVVLDEGVFDLAKALPGASDGSASLVELFDQNMAAVRTTIEVIDDEAMRERVPFVRDGKQLRELPRASLIRAILMNHTYHHRGQMSVYLRLLDVPVPATYGTSADEGM